MKSFSPRLTRRQTRKNQRGGYCLAKQYKCSMVRRKI